MIVKIPSIKPGSSSSFARLAKYIADAPRDGEKVLHQAFANCGGESVEDATMEIEGTQAQCTSNNTDKTYHMIVSFGVGERPDKNVLIDIEQRLADAIGLGGHQRISTVHDDTSHLHIHVAINKVHPETLRLVSPSWDFVKLQKVARELEREHGLVELAPENGKTAGSEKAADVAAHSKIVTFNEWAKEILRDPLAAVLDNEKSAWADFHKALAGQGVLIKLRGRGLIITTKNGRLYVKPSEIDRRFSKAALEKVLGKFVPGDLKIKRCPYRAMPRADDKASQALYDQYLSYRKSKGSMADLARERRAFYKGDYLAHKREAVDPIMCAYRAQRHKIWSDAILTRRQKYQALQSLKRALAKELAAPRAELSAMRKTVNAQTSVLNWAEYLIQEAQIGNEQALLALSHSEKPTVQSIGNVLLGLRDSKKPRLEGKMAPTVHKNGDISFGREEKRFVVSGRAVHVFGHDERVMQSALEYATERYGKRLSINGDKAFITSVEHLIHKNKLDIKITQCIKRDSIER